MTAKAKDQDLDKTENGQQQTPKTRIPPTRESDPLELLNPGRRFLQMLDDLYCK